MVLFHQFGEAQQGGFTLRRGRLRPVAALECAARRADRQIDIGAAAARHLRQLAPAGGIFDGEAFPFGGRLITAINKQSVLNMQGLRPVLPVLQVVEIHTLLR